MRAQLGPTFHTYTAQLLGAQPLAWVSMQGLRGEGADCHGHQARGDTIPELRKPSPTSRSLSARWGGRSMVRGCRSLVSRPHTSPA